MGGAGRELGGNDEYKSSFRKPEKNGPLRGRRHTWEDNIEIDNRKIGVGGVDWILLTQDKDRLVLFP